MGKIQKKGEKGAARNYITRTQAVRRLQLSLPEFRRLCILKGIYPREPKNKKRAAKGKSTNTTFYFTKDIQYLLHEPILQKFRERKSFFKKLYKAAAKWDNDGVQAMVGRLPRYTLDHLVKERYPTFIDALRDLDDCLCHLVLFANMPASEDIEQERINRCQEMLSEFMHFVIRTGALKKCFLSIKGIYYQAEIKGQTITWLVPYQFTQHVPTDIDFRVMLTFLEFYETMFGFVVYKLFSEHGWAYPPEKNARLVERGASALACFEMALNGQQQQAPLKKSKNKKLAADEQEALKERLQELEQKLELLPSAKDEQAAGDAVAIVDADADAGDTDADHRPLTDKVVFISRELPREPVEFVLRALGAHVCWSGVGSPHPETYAGITHQVTDRPLEGLSLRADRMYIQPQWVFDCLNAHKPLPEQDYAPGKELPPHLSPFVAEPSMDEDEKEEQAGAETTTTITTATNEKQELAKIVMSNKKRKLLERIEQRQQKERDDLAKLKAKRKAHLAVKKQ